MNPTAPRDTDNTVSPLTAVTPTLNEIAHDDPNGMTVLFACDTGTGFPFMAKTWSQGEAGIECQPYDNAMFFKVKTYSVASSGKLTHVLGQLKATKNGCAIRGELVPGTKPDNVMRRSRERDDQPATFRECKRCWILLDFDTYLLKDFPDPITDPQGCAEAVRKRLPPGLRGVFCFWSFSSSTGIKPGKLGIHLYFVMETALGWRDSEAFIAACGADLAMSRTVQVHYTAAPAFLAPLTDPLKKRFGVMLGVERVPASVVAELVATGHLCRAREQAVERVTTKRVPTVPKPKTEAEAVHEPAPGMIGDGSRNKRLMGLAGYARKRGVDAAGLERLLTTENANHCDPPLDTQRVESMAASYANYPVAVVKKTLKPRELAVSIAAGLHRHGACVEAVEAIAGHLLDDATAGTRMVAALLAKPNWEIDLAEFAPEMVVLP